MPVSADDLKMLTETARDWMERHAPAVAGLRRDPVLAARLWDGIAEMGWTAAAVPEDQGGAGFAMTGLGSLLHTVGREIADIPLLGSAIAALLIARSGSEAARGEMLSRLLSGEARAALALGEGAHHDHIDMTATRAGHGWRLNGRKSWVQGGADADWLLVSAQADATAIFLVEGKAVRSEAVESVDGRAFAHILLEDVVVSEDALLGGGSETASLALDLARVGLAAEMVGATERAIEITVDYLKTREQFGRRIGSFQALQHRAAQMLIDLELARSCVGAALAAADAGAPAFGELALLAKYMAGEAIHNASNEMVQLHGGMGMTSEHLAGNYLKWARVSEALLAGNAQIARQYAALKGY